MHFDLGHSMTSAIEPSDWSSCTAACGSFEKHVYISNPEVSESMKIESQVYPISSTIIKNVQMIPYLSYLEEVDKAGWGKVGTPEKQIRALHPNLSPWMHSTSQIDDR